MVSLPWPLWYFCALFYIPEGICCHFWQVIHIWNGLVCNSRLFCSLQVPSLHLEQDRATQQLLITTFPSIQTQLMLPTPPQVSRQQQPTPTPPVMQLLLPLQLKVSISPVVSRCIQKYSLRFKWNVFDRLTASIHPLSLQYYFHGRVFSVL